MRLLLLPPLLWRGKHPNQVGFSLKHCTHFCIRVDDTCRSIKVNYSTFFPPALECLRNEKSSMGSKVCRRQVCMSPVHREVPKTNGHSVNLGTQSSIIPKSHPSPRLGRPLNLRPGGMPRYSLHFSVCLQGEKKTFPLSRIAVFTQFIIMHCELLSCV